MKTILTIIAALTLAHSAFGQVAQPSGDYVMVGLDQNNVPNSVLSSPALTGWQARTGWDSVANKGWVYLDSQVAKASQLNKHLTLSLYANKDHYPNNHSELTYDSVVAQFGAKYDKSPWVDAVHFCPLWAVASQEWFSAPGWTDAQLIAEGEHDIDQYAKAFPDKTIIADLAMAGSYNSPVTPTLISYMEKVGHVSFSFDSLHATTDPNYKPYAYEKAEAAKGFLVGDEMVSGSNDQSRFGGKFSTALAIGNAAGAKWYQIYQQDVGNLPKGLHAGATPEPPTLLSLITGIVGMALIVRRQRARARGGINQLDN